MLLTIAILCSLQLVRTLLDIRATPGKPNYEMAPDGPLMLYGCEYDGLTMNRSASECRHERSKSFVGLIHFVRWL